MRQRGECKNRKQAFRSKKAPSKKALKALGLETTTRRRHERRAFIPFFIERVDMFRKVRAANSHSVLRDAQRDQILSSLSKAGTNHCLIWPDVSAAFRFDCNFDGDGDDERD